MLKEPTQDQIDGPALSEEVYHLALERIKALMGSTEDSPEERELIDWATIADAYEHTQAAAPALARAPQQATKEAHKEHGREQMAAAEPGDAAL